MISTLTNLSLISNHDAQRRHRFRYYSSLSSNISLLHSSLHYSSIFQKVKQLHIYKKKSESCVQTTAEMGVSLAWHERKKESCYLKKN